MIKLSVFVLSLTALSTAYAARSCVTPADEWGSQYLIAEVEPGRLLSSAISFKIDSEYRKSLDQLKDLRDVLKSRGTELVLVPVPPSGIVYGNLLNVNELSRKYPPVKDFNFSAGQKAYREMVKVLNENGIATVSLLDVALQNKAEFFLKQDHHWSPRGAQWSASAVASVVRQKFPSLLPKMSQVQTSVVKKAPKEQLGSYADQARRCGWVFSQEKFDDIQMEDANLGLLDEIGDFTLLLGDSFSKRPLDESFSIYLREALGVEVVNAAVDGGGLTDAMLKYFSEPQNHLQMPKLVIWQFASGYSQLNNELFFRQAIPAVGTPCTANNAIASVSSASQSGSSQDLVLKIPEGTSISGPQYFVKLELSNLNIKTFSYFFQYRDGNTDGLYYERSDRLNNLGHFNLMLNGTNKSSLSQIRIELPKSETSKASLSLCRFPR